MLFLEYNWTAGNYIARFGSVPTSINNKRSWDTLSAADADLRKRGLCVGNRTDNRTWRIVSILERKY